MSSSFVRLRNYLIIFRFFGIKLTGMISESATAFFDTFLALVTPHFTLLGIMRLSFLGGP